MNDLVWKEKYEIGHPLIDKEHRHLFEIAVEAFKPVPPKEKKQKIKETIHELSEYMKTHFKHEESLMRVIEFPELYHHEAIHHVIINNMGHSEITAIILHGIII